MYALESKRKMMPSRSKLLLLTNYTIQRVGVIDPVLIQFSLHRIVHVGVIHDVELLEKSFFPSHNDGTYRRYRGFLENSIA